MEYNYTHEFKQPHKFYSVKGIAIPFAPNGIRADTLFIGLGFVVLLGIIWFIGFVTHSDFLTSLFMNYWMLVIAGSGVLIWTLFSLKWDNKNFVDYLMGRVVYASQRNERFEHEMPVQYLNKKMTYQGIQTRRVK
ncbi:hypothetical protein BAU14_07115 [Enterococcus sp. CU9D]|nr:hypothetical protein BAU14_07115 [Enterococcus sp. CU9D]